MNIIVCIKQVPDTTDVRIDPATNTLIREGVASIINPFDMYAIEEALRLKDKHGGKTTVLSMGPPQAQSALREALSLGIDEAVHLQDRLFAGSDTWATSLVLARAIRKIGAFDLVICGKQASDGDTAQVGPGVAAHLDLPQATYVRRITGLDLGATPPVMKAERLLEDGVETLEIVLPALITVVKEINDPRLPSLKGKIRSRSQAIPVWGAPDLGIKEHEVGLKGSPTQVVSIFTPEARAAGVVLKGEPEEIASTLAQEIKGLL